MKEFVEKYRPVRQRTVRGETTTDKAGALPPAVYAEQSADCTKVDLARETEDELAPQHMTQLTFVDDSSISLMSK